MATATAAVLLPVTAVADAPDRLMLGGGAYDVAKTQMVTADFFAEYRFGWRAGDAGPDSWFRGVGPMIGYRVTAEGSMFGYGSAVVDLRPFERVAVWPSFGVAGYRQGGGRDLGGIRQFHVEMAISYDVPDAGFLGVSWQHVSNAGSQPSNPGNDALFVTYTLPVGSLF